MSIPEDCFQKLYLVGNDMRFLELWVDKEITLFFGEDRMKVKGILKAADEMFIYLLDADNEINALQLRDVKHIRLKCDKAG